MSDDSNSESATVGQPARPSLDRVMDAVADVNGWMTPGQAATLYDSAVRCGLDSQIVEIGSFQGRSTIVLALAADPSTKVIAIDPHAGNDRGPQEIQGYDAQASDDNTTFNKNLADAGVADRVVHLRKFSDDALADVEGPIGLLYIDGAHRFAPARSDIVSWGAKVDDGATMLIHDSFSSIGVTFAILRELVAGSRFRYVGRSRSMAIYRADLATSGVSRGANAGRQLAQLPWFVGNLFKKVFLSVGGGRVLAKLGRPVPEWPY